MVLKFCIHFSLWGLRGRSPRLQTRQSWEQVPDSVSQVSHVPGNKTPGEAIFLPSPLPLKWIQPPSAHTCQPCHSPGPWQPPWWHMCHTCSPRKARRVCSPAPCSPHAVLQIAAKRPGRRSYHQTALFLRFF